eukprot:1461223-Rhodomonas_salina.1
MTALHSATDLRRKVPVVTSMTETRTEGSIAPCRTVASYSIKQQHCTVGSCSSIIQYHTVAAYSIIHQHCTVGSCSWITQYRTAASYRRIAQARSARVRRAGVRGWMMTERI